MQLVVKWLEHADWTRWDRFVERHAWGSLVQTSSWKTVIEQSFPHIGGRCCALVDAESGEITAGLAVYKVASFLLGTRLVSIPFATLSDPLVANEDEFSRLMAAVRQEALNSGIGRIEIRCTHAPVPTVHPDWIVASEFKHHFLPLDRSEEEILASFHRRAVRAMIARAERSGLHYRHDTSEESLQAFYRLFLKTRRRLALPPIPFAFFRALHTNLVPRGALTYALVESGSTLAAAGLVLKSGSMSAIEYLGDRVEHRRDGANQMLYWGAILDAMREGRATFSFGRTSVGNEGLLIYKRRWGTQESELTALHTRPRKNIAQTARERSWPYRLVSRLCATVPLPVYRLIGNFCYRHMG